jgi:MSHA biogenesis protein MshE
MGLRASMTGHLVLSTLHTNDAISTAIRLLDMGGEGYLVATALKAVLAQRLVRRICDSCIEDHKLDTNEWAWAQEMIGERADKVIFKHGTGCPHCNNTGYRGRIGVYELLEISNEIADALRRNDTSGFTNAAQRQHSFVPLAKSCMEYATSGITTIEEVMRIAGEASFVEEDLHFDLGEEIAAREPL